MGRADQTTKIKGMFVHPRQIAEVAKRHPEVIRARLVVESGGENDRLTLNVETSATGLDAALKESFQSLCKLKTEVAFHAPGALPNDGIVIQDKRA
jgi:phenylacetate-CoA ligase